MPAAPAPAVSALILSAGLGTRLAPLSSWRAKPLVPIGDRPAVAHIVARVRPCCAGPIVLNAHHRADEVEVYARSAGLEVSREEELLGTGGGLARAAELLGPGDVLVWNGDMIGDLDVGALLAAHTEAGAAVATLVVQPRGDALGNVGLDAAGGVVRLRRETCRAGETRTADFLGVYVVAEPLRRALPRAGDIIAEGLLPALRRGGRVEAFACDAPFLDIGTPASYLEANLRWLASRGERVWTGEGARVGAGVVIDGVVVGVGGRVVGEGRVAECVVWPGGEARAPLENAIVAPEGVVHVARG